MEGPTSESVSTRIRSGGSSSSGRLSRRIVSWPSGLSTSPLRLNATAHSPARPSASIASRTSPSPRRATSIQWTGPVLAQRARQPPGVGGDHVAADLGVAAVHLAHLLGRLHERARAPEALVVSRDVAGAVELRSRAAVEHDATV